MTTGTAAAGGTPAAAGTAATAAAPRPGFLKTALRLGRVSNLPTVWTNVLAGTALAGAPLEAWYYLPIAAAMSAQYVGGMYLNDGFDARWDADNRAERPIPAGHISRGFVLGAGFALLAFGLAGMAAMCALHWLSSWRPFFAAAALAALIVYYDLHHKQNPLSPLVMGLCRVGVYLTAGLTALSFHPRLWTGCVLLLCHLIGLSYIAKHETKSRVDHVWPVLLFIAPVGYVLAQAPREIATMAALAAYALVASVGVTSALGIQPWRGASDRRPDPRFAVPFLIAAISLLDAIFLAMTATGPLALAAVAAFALTLVLQRVVPGT